MPETSALYDFGPTGRLMLVGVLLALGPLAWVWLRQRGGAPAQRLRALTWVTLFLTFDLVIFGAFTRLSDSGLGCPDWPGCYGSASPIGAREEITQAQTALPTGPVTHGKAWVEMIHRYLASAVGVLILTLAAATFWLSRRRETGQGAAPLHVSPAWPLLTLFWVCMQGAFGALTVTMKLFPAIVTLHLLGGMALLALLQVQASRYAQADATRALAGPQPISASARLLLWLGFALLWLQIALGGWVSTNYAVLACTEFPGCQGSFWPAMDFRQGFTLWRELGAGRDGGNISFAALTAIHYVHRLAAYVVMLVLLVLALKLRREPATQQSGRWILALIVWQFVSGLSNVVLGWPLVAALAHTAGAAALVVVMTATICNTRTAARAKSIAPLTQLSA
jgi:cytochrome c oxidase assembly protein subunit 15